MNIVLNIPLPNSNGLRFFGDLEEKDEILTELMNDEAVCRTSPTTPGLLNTRLNNATATLHN